MKTKMKSCRKEVHLEKFAQLPQDKRRRAEARFHLIKACDEFIRRNSLSRQDEQVQKFIIGLILNKPNVRPQIIYKSIQTKYPDAARHFSVKTIERFIAQWRKKNDQLYAMFIDPDRWKNRYSVSIN